MGNIREDVDYACSRNRYRFDLMYSRTNEDLLSLFNQINVEGEDVFTVLSSSDYLFSALDRGARSVDTFDINPLTYRYYYLRKWLLQQGLIDASGLKSSDVLEIIDECLPMTSKDERDSEFFWRYYLSSIRTKDVYFYSDDLFLDMRVPQVIYESNLERLSKRLDNLELNFKTADICSPMVTNQKYDTIFLSNILDYNRVSNSTLRIASDNLYRLLNNGGRVVLSHFIFFPNIDGEKEIFSKNFIYDEITNGSVSYYQYTKK